MILRCAGSGLDKYIALAAVDGKKKRRFSYSNERD